MSNFNKRFKEILKNIPPEIAEKLMTLLNNHLISGDNDPVRLAMIPEIFHFEKFIPWRMINICPLTEAYTEFCFYDPLADITSPKLQTASINVKT